MRGRRRGFAVVVDEHGGFAGVLTIKDLVSELVGDLHDEFDRSPQPRRACGSTPSRCLVDGSVRPSPRSASSVGVDLPDGEYVTLGGFLFDAFGHIPDRGEAPSSATGGPSGSRGWTAGGSPRWSSRHHRLISVQPTLAAPTGRGAEREVAQLG